MRAGKSRCNDEMPSTPCFKRRDPGTNHTISSGLNYLVNPSPLCLTCAVAAENCCLHQCIEGAEIEGPNGCTSHMEAPSRKRRDAMGPRIDRPLREAVKFGVGPILCILEFGEGGDWRTKKKTVRGWRRRILVLFSLPGFSCEIATKCSLYLFHLPPHHSI